MAAVQCGSSYLEPRRNKKSDPKLNALERAVKKLGSEAALNSLRESWKQLNDSELYEEADGMVISLIAQNYSQREIRAVLLGLGGYWFDRIAQEFKNPSIR